MYKKIEMGTCKTSVDNDKEYIYRYFLVETTKQIDVNGISVTVPCYGADIVREELKDGKIIDIYMDMIDCLTPVYDKAKDFIEYLKNNEVSPVHLIDVAGVYADEWVEDFDRQAAVLMEATAAIM